MLLRVARSIITEPAVAGRVAKFYKLGVKTTAHLEQTEMHDTYAIHAGERVFFFKLFRFGLRSIEQITAEADALLKLRAAGVPVARPVFSAGGNAVCALECPEGRRFGLLCEKLSGSMVTTPAAADFRALGGLTARIHTARGLDDVMRRRPPLDLAVLVETPTRLVREAAWLDVKFRRQYVKHAASMARTWTRLAAQGLPEGFCHGDLHSGNVVKDDRGTLRAFDFDLSGRGWFAYDLAVFKWNRLCFGDQVALAGTWRAYLAGYRSVRKLSVAEVEAVDKLVLARHLWVVGHVVASAPVAGASWFRWSQARLAKKLDEFAAL